MTFRAAGDGVRLATYAWEATGELRGLVFLMHGYGEHAGRYGGLVRELNAYGFSVHALDHRGHGASQGRRAFVADSSSVARDFKGFLTETLKAHPGLPAALFGHSMGGAAAVQVAAELQDRLFGLVLSSPFIDAVPAPNALKRWAVGLLARIAPGLPVQKLDTKGLSHQAEEVTAYEQDEQVHHGPVVAATANSLVEAGESALRFAPSLRLPLLVFHGEDDAIAGPEGTRRLFAAAGSAHKELRMVKGALHEMLNDSGRDEMVSELRDWLVDRLRISQDG